VNAAAYFTITNNTGAPDVLRSVASGAGAETSLHTEQGGSMHAASAGLSIPARGSVVLAPGKGHLMIEKLYGPLKAGQSVNFELEFDKNGRVLVTAPVIAVTAPAPTAAPR
jgi:copper(I)-binding protein